MSETLPASRRAELIERLAQEITARRLGEPALLFLGASMPLGNLGSHLLYGAEPLLAALVNRQSIRDYALLFEDRTALTELIDRIEGLLR